MIELPRPYPLTWPTGRDRAKYTSTSRFETRYSNGKSLATVCDELDAELRRMGVTNFVLSTNTSLNSRGRPDSRISQQMDCAAALYFEHEKRQICLACDKWDKVACNVMAIVKHLDALRGQQRWGVADLKRDFSGYAALPEKGEGHAAWYDVLGVPADANTDAINARFRVLAKTLHPDAGGGGEEWHRINEAKNIGLASQPR